MKKISITLTFSGMALLGIAQDFWSTNLNEQIGPDTPRLGTMTNIHLPFYTNGIQQMTLKTNGVLNLKSLAEPGTDDTRLVWVDSDGNFTVSAKQAGGAPVCRPSALPWVMGGNYANPGSATKDNIIGTCSDHDFILKANDVPMLYMKTTSTQNFYGSTLLGIGPNNSNPQAQLDVSDGISATWANRTNPDHLRIYGDYGGSIESTGRIGLYYQDHFSISTGFFNQGNAPTRFEIDANGLVGIGQSPVTARLGINGIGTDGLTIKQTSSATTNAFAIGDGLSTKFTIYGDGKTHIRDNVQIGFSTTVGFADPNFRLNLDASGPSRNGLKLTTNYRGVMIEVNNSLWARPVFSVDGDGTTYIGLKRPSGPAAAAKLSVDGMILANDIRVAASTSNHWADFVFNKNYKLMSLKDVDTFVKLNSHLPDVPSEAEVKENGFDLVQMNIILLQKVEELYLHSIALQKQLDAQSLMLSKLKESDK